MTIADMMATFPPHTKFELSRAILAIPMYMHRQMLHLRVALNPKELLVGDMSIAVLMAAFPYVPTEVAELGDQFLIEFAPQTLALALHVCSLSKRIIE